MLKRILTSLALLILVACSPGGSQEAPQASDPALTQAAFETPLTDVATGEVLAENPFTGHAVTMVNFWATFCSPCIEEMPDLGKMSRDLGQEDFRLVGIVADVPGPENQKGAGLAQKIIADTQADFTHVYITPEIQARYGSPQAVPTTLFLNAQGQVIGEPVVGALSQEDYTKIVRDLLAEEAA